MRTMEDSDILALYTARDQLAISETAKKFGGLCKTIAKNILGSREDAEECLNDALYKLWESIPPAEPRDLGAYLTVTVRNIACNRRAKEHAEKRGGGQIHAAFEELCECIAAPDTPEDHLNYTELTDALNRFLAERPQETRVMFVLRYWSALSVSEVAEKCCVSQSKVKMTLLRTRNKLKAYLEEEGVL